MSASGKAQQLLAKAVPAQAGDSNTIVRPGGLGAKPPEMVPGGDQELGGGVVANAVEGEQAGG